MIERNWGGKRPNAGRKPRYVRIEKKFYTERSERELLTPESDLSICLAETEPDEETIHPGIVIGDIWYGKDEALAIAKFVQSHRSWLLPQEEDFYTYTLAYPESMGSAVFYVGKGTGNRIDQHEEEARRDHQCKKCDIIHSIWTAGEEIVKRKEHEHLSEEDAFTLEMRLVEQLGISHLANKQKRLVNPMTSEERRQVIEHTKQVVARHTIMTQEEPEIGPEV